MSADLAFRPVDPHDRTPIVAVFDGLSEQSRYLRYFGPKPRLSDSEIRYFTEVDHHDHEAIVATARDVAVGVARYVRRREDPASADVAVEVVDEWQGRGVGSALLRRIARRAREEGVSSLHGTVLSSNRAMLATIDTLAAPWHTTSRDGPVLGIEIELAGTRRAA
ncbi:MAG TPA: GNAT family N-acetyltransferase [Acidimicrobiia bacterium]|jgi:GNAT superfamily N-acetyltransferase